MGEQKNRPDRSHASRDLSGQEGSKKVSRIVVDFSEPGSAVVTGFQMVNVTPGQIMLFAKWAEGHAALAFQHMVAQTQAQAQPRIIVPKVGLAG